MKKDKLKKIIKEALEKNADVLISGFGKMSLEDLKDSARKRLNQLSNKASSEEWLSMGIGEINVLSAIIEAIKKEELKNEDRF